MKMTDVLKYFGTAKNLREALDKTPKPATKQSISKWYKAVPYFRQYQIEVITKGKLKAERRKGK